MGLKTSNGKIAKPKKTNSKDMVNNLTNIEIKKQEDSSRGESFEVANANVVKEVSDNQISKLSILDLYAAPNNSEWNSFSKLSSDKEFELQQTIIDGGQMTPIIVWEIDKDSLSDIYANNEDEYGFVGNKYMILAGHSRTNSFIKIYNATKDEKYTKIDAIVRTNLTYDQARYIIKVTNYATRELSTKEKRENIRFLYRHLTENKTKGMNIAKKIADDTRSKLRTVQYNISINEKLIPEFIEMYDNEAIPQWGAIKLTRLTKPMQEWMYGKYGDLINEKSLKGLRPSYTKKEEIETLFKNKDVVEYIKVISDIPKDKEKKFRKMVENWLAKNK